MITQRILHFTIALGIPAALLMAHATWIFPVHAVIEVGKPLMVQIGNGHDIAESESPLGQRGLEMFAVSPSGTRTTLTPAVSGNLLAAEYSAKEKGSYVFGFVQDRPISSRTPGGVKQGGRDKNPDATEVFKAYRSGLAYAATAGAQPQQGKAFGLVFELVPQRAADSVTVIATQNGKPCAGAAITVHWPGKGEAKAGKTGADGKFAYKIPAGAKGQFVIAASHSEKAAAGAGYDNASYATALYLNW
jgi:uncharacterized GH25 family protein